MQDKSNGVAAPYRASRQAIQVSVVIPAINEARNLPPVLERIGSEVLEVVLVDGLSTDGTVQVARQVRPDIRVIQQTRRGKGNALACGFHACRGDVIVTLDADGSCDPAEIPAFVAALAGGAHFAQGTRVRFGGASDDLTLVRRVGNWGLNRMVNALYGTHYTDHCYGYNAFWASCLPYLNVSEPGYELGPDELAGANGRVPSNEVRWGDGFEIETLLAVRLAVLGMRVAEVGSFEADRAHGSSNLHAVRDGMRVFRTIAAERRRMARHQLQQVSLPRPWETDRGVRLSPAVTPEAAELIDLTEVGRVTPAGSSRAPLRVSAETANELVGSRRAGHQDESRAISLP